MGTTFSCTINIKMQNAAYGWFSVGGVCTLGGGGCRHRHFVFAVFERVTFQTVQKDRLVFHLHCSLERPLPSREEATEYHSIYIKMRVMKEHRLTTRRGSF